MFRQPRLVKTLDEEPRKRLSEDVIDLSRAFRRLNISTSRAQLEPEGVARAKCELAVGALLVTVSGMMIAFAVCTFHRRPRRPVNGTDLFAGTSKVNRYLGDQLIIRPRWWFAMHLGDV